MENFNLTNLIEIVDYTNSYYHYKSKKKLYEEILSSYKDCTDKKLLIISNKPKNWLK